MSTYNPSKIYQWFDIFMVAQTINYYNGTVLHPVVFSVTIMTLNNGAIDYSLISLNCLL